MATLFGFGDDHNDLHNRVPGPRDLRCLSLNDRNNHCSGFSLMYIIKAGRRSWITQETWEGMGNFCLGAIFSSDCAHKIHRLDPPRLKLCQPDRADSAFLLAERFFAGWDVGCCCVWTGLSAKTTGLNPGFRGSGGFGIGAGSGGGGEGSRGGVGWNMLGVSGLFGVDVDGAPSSVVQPPLLKEYADVVGGGGIDVT